METLEQFYDEMAHTATVRRTLVKTYLNAGRADPGDVQELEKTLAALRGLKRSAADQYRYVVALDAQKTVELDLSYEIGELEKDLLFFQKGEDALIARMAELHAPFRTEVDKLVTWLQAHRFHNFVTDRDGTVNNYCGRYRSSVQSAYNAVFLTRFIQQCTDHAVIITSAPLRDPGIVDVSVMPPSTFIYAASKAREFIDEAGERRTFPVDPKQQELLDAFNAKLQSLVEQPAYRKFALIGSGLQLKFGETTMARQDITGTIPQDESKAFLATVRDLVRQVDPELQSFTVDDTGLDIEVVLNVAPPDAQATGKEFDKADGLLFLDRELDLHLAEGETLVCGDTGSDVRLVEACVDKNESVYSVFATEDEALANRVARRCRRFMRVSGPDMLVTALNLVAQKGEVNGS
jgi:hypothetical protein